MTNLNNRYNIKCNRKNDPTTNLMERRMNLEKD